MFPFRFFAGYPGLVKVYQHEFIETKELTQKEKPELKDQTRNVILSKLAS